MRDVDAALLATRPAFFHLADGTSVLVRAIQPGDAGRLQAYVRGLSVESRRNRFLGILSELAPTELFRISRMSRPDALALVAFVADGREEAMAIVAELGRKFGGSESCSEKRKIRACAGRWAR